MVKTTKPGYIEAAVQGVLIIVAFGFLAENCQADADALYRLLRALAASA